MVLPDETESPIELSTNIVVSIPVTWHVVVLRQKYNDPLKLKNTLDTLYGEGNYKVKVRYD